MHRAPRRPAYTLLEVVLALAIGVMLLAAVYGALSYQIRQAQAGRDLIDEANLVRVIVAKMENDVLATVALSDPARFRAAQSGPGGGGGSAGTTTPTTTTPSSGTSMASSSTSSSASSSSGTPPVVLPLGVIGDSSTLTLVVSKLPTESWPGRDGSAGQLVSDLRVINYWVADTGLCRQEMPVITSQDVVNLIANNSAPSGDTMQCRMAREVKSIEIRYFDGTNWQDSWNSTLAGDDGVTPLGSPRAIEVRLGIRHRHMEGNKDGELKYYRHTIPIIGANGPTQANNNTQPNSTTSGGGS
jgi:hypothetical protein